MVLVAGSDKLGLQVGHLGPQLLAQLAFRLQGDLGLLEVPYAVLELAEHAGQAAAQALITRIVVYVELGGKLA